MALQEQLREARRSPPGRPPRRWDLVAAWAVLAGPALALALAAGLRQRTGDLEQRLVRDAHALLVAARPRPVHVGVAAPGPGGDALARQLPALEAEARALAADEPARDAARAYVRGAAAAPPGRYAAALDRLGPALDGVLASSRRERADFAEGPDPFASAGGKPWDGYHLAALLAGVRIRLALSAGEPRAAVADCLDGLGVGRDASIAGGLVGRMTGAGIVLRLVEPCAAALDALPPAELAGATSGLRAIRDALPPLSAMQAEEAVASQLFAGRYLAPSIAPALPPRARAMFDEAKDEAPWWERLAARDAWRDSRAAQDALVAAADLDDPERERAYRAVEARLARRLNFLSAFLPIEKYLTYARRAENARRRLDALVVAAAALAHRAETGAWPASAGALQGAGRVRAEELAGGALRLEPDAAGGLVVRAALLDAGEVDARGVRLALSGPAATGRAAPPRAAAPR